MIRIAICDGEKVFRDNIKEILSAYMQQKEILCEICTFRSGKEFLDLGIEMMKYKIIFLDVTMEDFDGIKIAQKIREVSGGIFIVLMVVCATYAFDGYKVDAVRCILKNNANLKESVYECMDAISIKMNYNVERKTFHFNEGTKNVSLQQLLYIESQLHRLEFHIMEDNLNKYTLYGILNKLEKEFEGSGFLRIHQSYLVNMRHIKKVNRYKALLSNGMQLDIPRARYKYVEEMFIAYNAK